VAIDAENLTEGQTEAEENDNPELEAETETADESEGEEESTTEEAEAESPTAKYDSRLAALEDQLKRSNEDRDTLRETLRLNQQLVEQTRPQKPTKQLTDEQKALKELGLTFGDDVQTAMEPLVGTVSRLFDQNDAVQFQMQMSRVNPALMQGDSFDKLSQAVETVRQQYARATGQYLPRMDAYKYAKGAGMLDGLLTAKSTVSKGAVDNEAELKRQSEVKAAGTIKSSTKKVDSASGGADIQKIREKAQRGERLTQAERTKFRNYLADKPF
jgi:hypothetical protein